MRSRGLFIALIAGGLQLYACGGPGFETAEPSSSDGGAPGGMGGEGTGGAGSGGDGLGGAATGGASSGGAATGGDGTGGAGEPDIPKNGLVLWLRADEGVTTSSGRVTAWQDQSENGGSALQTSNSWRPTLVASGLHGKPTVLFDGVDDFLNLPDGFEDFSQGVSLFVVLREDEPGPCANYVALSNGIETDDVVIGQWDDALLYEVANDWTETEDSLIVAQPQLVTAIHGVDGSVQLRRDGDEIALDTFAMPVKTVRTENFVGKSVFDNCTYFSGAISEVLMYDRGVGDSELVQIESYLQERWLNP